MKEDQNIEIPEDLLPGGKVEITFFSDTKKGLGILGLSERTIVDEYILHLYRLFYNSSTDQYEPIQELEAFQFQTKADMNRFIQELPHISALDMLLLLNPTVPPREPYSFLM